MGGTVVVQKSVARSISGELRPGGSSTFYARCENWLSPPPERPNEPTHDLRRAMLPKRVCDQLGPMATEDKLCMHTVAASVEALLLTPWPNGASQSQRLARRLFGSAYKKEWLAHMSWARS